VESDVDALMIAIQAGPLEQEPWSKFVRLLRRVLRGNYVNVVFRRRDWNIDEMVVVHDSSMSKAALERKYRRDFVQHDKIPYFSMSPGRVYFYDELDGVASLEYDPFREEFLRVADLEHFLIVRISGSSGCNIWISMTRSAGEAPFNEEERALCGRLARAFTPALECYSALLDRTIQAEIYRRAADLLSFGVITVDGKGRVIRLDDAARRCIEEVPELSVCNGRLRASHDDKKLQRGLSAALLGTGVEAVHLGDNRGLDLLIVPFAKRPDMEARAVRLMIYLSGRAPGNRDVAAPLAALFGLTSSQARLAMLLTRGLSLAEAASAMGITEKTARTYSKEIFLRTGTARQSELIQRILTSVVMLH